MEYKAGDKIYFVEEKAFPFEDLTRFMEHAFRFGVDLKEIRMPADYYKRLTPEQIAWAEENFHCKLKPIKPIAYRMLPKFRISKEETFKTSSPKEYGIGLMKRKRR